MKDIENILEWIGLSKNEAKIYITVLNIGKSGVTEISKKSNIKRTTIYSYINPLLEKSYLKRSIHGKRTFFIAESPKRLLEIFEAKKTDFLKKLPFLEEIYNNNAPKPKVELYEWKKQVKDAYRRMETSWVKVFSFFSPEKFNAIVWEEFEEELESISSKHGTTAKTLLKNDPFWKRHIKNPHTWNNSKLLPQDFDLEVDINIVKDTVILISFDPLQAIFIKNKFFADFFKNLHNYFWKIL